MSENPFINYYVKQAESGISGFDGVRNQRGKGFFGSVFRSAVFPLLKYLGKQSFRTGMDIASDIIDGEPAMDSIKKRSKNTIHEIAGDIADRATTFKQTGRGIRKRRKTVNKKKVNKKIKNKTKRSTKRKKFHSKRKSKSIF